MKTLSLRKYMPVLLFTGLIATSCQNNQKAKSGTDDYFISTESESDDRVKKLDLDKHSEDASHILDISKLAIPQGQHTGPGDTVTKGRVIEAFDKEAMIILQGNQPFKGELVWDVLQSLGLKWGDGDLFHWRNVKGDYGDDQFFSVWTSTEPGYFLPESVKAGKMNPNDLVFGFSIPRNADPKNVYALMIEAVKYCQRRLGGQILDQNLQSFNETSEKKNIEALVNQMKTKSVIPGSDKALMTY